MSTFWVLVLVFAAVLGVGFLMMSLRRGIGASHGRAREEKGDGAEVGPVTNPYHKSAGASRSDADHGHAGDPGGDGSGD